jgi:hypothetical protein
MKTFADIEKIFFREKRPYFVVKDSRGARKSTTPSSIMDITDDTVRLKDSYDFLAEAVADFDDGKYKLLLRTSENAGKGELSYDFQIGDASTATSSKGQGTGATIGGFNISGLETIMGLVNGGQSEANRLREEKADLKLELLRKDFEIEKLKETTAVSGAGESWSDVLKGIAKEYFPDILDKYTPAKTEVSSVRGSKPVPPDAGKKPKNSATTDRAELDKEGTEQKMSQKEVQERLTAIFERTAKMVEGYNPLIVIEVVIDMAEKNDFVIKKLKKELAKKYESDTE